MIQSAAIFLQDPYTVKEAEEVPAKSDSEGVSKVLVRCEGRLNVKDISIT